MSATDNCFDLVGDGDDVDVVEAIEEVFDLEITDSEAVSCDTFGQLFDVVWDKIRSPEHSRVKCPSAVTFYRLRAGLRTLGFVESITPDSDLSEFFRRNGARHVKRELAKAVGLELPSLGLRASGKSALVGVFLIGAVGSVACYSWLSVLSAAFLAAGLTPIVPRVLPRKIATMRDFVPVCVAWNYGKLAKVCGGTRSRDVWNALGIVVRESCGSGFKGPINRETRFFPLKA